MCARLVALQKQLFGRGMYTLLTISCLLVQCSESRLKFLEVKDVSEMVW